jgi:hypothetical protein
VWLIVAGCGHIIGQDVRYSYTGGEDLILETLLTAYALVGLPIILAAFWGTFTKIPQLLRAYWYYMLVSFVLLLIWIVRYVIASGPCTRLPSIVRQQYGSAFTCGMMRGLHVVVVLCLVFIPIYLILIVLSYADDVSLGIVGPELSDLAVSKDSFKKPQSGIMNTYERACAVNANGYGNPNRGGKYGAVYRQAIQQGMGGSTSLFGRTRHDLEFGQPY